MGRFSYARIAWPAPTTRFKTGLRNYAHWGERMKLLLLRLARTAGHPAPGENEKGVDGVEATRPVDAELGYAFNDMLSMGSNGA